MYLFILNKNNILIIYLTYILIKIESSNHKCSNFNIQ